MSRLEVESKEFLPPQPLRALPRRSTSISLMQAEPRRVHEPLASARRQSCEVRAKKGCRRARDFSASVEMTIGKKVAVASAKVLWGEKVLLAWR